MLWADVRLYRDGLVRALAGSADVEVVGAAPISEASLPLLVDTSPDIVLLEAAAASRPEVVQSILEVAPQAKVVAFAIADEEQDAIHCAEAGAAGYVSREASIEDLVATIVRVAHGEFPCSARVAALLAHRISFLAAERAPNATASALTRRERQILRLIDDGLSNKEIAQRLTIEVSTVKNHVHHILDKTQASRRSQAAARFRTPWQRRSEPTGARAE
jgi:two-component system nitrate/nitrite response regulator NarL